MTESEEDMVRKLREQAPEQRFTSLQPTYEDSVPPDVDEEWELDERS